MVKPFKNLFLQNSGQNAMKLDMQYWQFWPVCSNYDPDLTYLYQGKLGRAGINVAKRKQKKFFFGNYVLQTMKLETRPTK